MKKTVLSLAVASLVLAGCGKSSSGLSKKTVDGQDVIASVGGVNIFADKVNDIVTGNESGNKSIYNQVSKLLVKTAYPITSDIKASAEVKVEQFKTTAKETASANGTNYEDELKTAMEGLGVSTQKELKKYYEHELQKSKLSDKFWETKENDYYSAYVDEALPYHLSHTLVTLGATNMHFLDTISEQNAKDIGNIINDLKKGRSFDFVAQNYSSDTSADQGGDLGLMDVNTAFVSEFKYSVYMLDYYTQLTKSANFFAETSDVYKGIVNKLKASDFYADGLNTIPMSQTELLLKVANNDKTSVHNYSVARTYARSIIFNEYFNQPAASVIVFDDETKLIEDTKDAEGNIISYGNYVELKTSDTSAPVKVLATGGKVVMAVRSTSLDDKSGLHFITIDQSPLDENAKTYFANDTEKDDNDNYVNKTYISFYGKDKEKSTKENLEKAVKAYIEKGVADSTALYDAALFELYFEENEDKLTLADNIAEILASYISSLKAEYEEAFNDKLDASISTYVKSLNTFESFRTDAHYIPMGCIDENGEPVYATINGSNVRVCTRQDGRWVIREADPNEYKIKTSIEVSGSATVNDNEIEVTEGNSKSVEITINDDYTLTGEAEKTALELFIDNEKFVINVDSLTDITVTLEGKKLTITFNNVKAEHKVEVKAAQVGGEG